MLRMSTSIFDAGKNRSAGCVSHARRLIRSVPHMLEKKRRFLRRMSEPPSAFRYDRVLGVERVRKFRTAYRLSTRSSFFTAKDPATPLARMNARFLSISLATTPCSETLPFFTIIRIDGCVPKR